jgi:hypothetical protein
MIVRDPLARSSLFLGYSSIKRPSIQVIEVDGSVTITKMYLLTEKQLLKFSTTPSTKVNGTSKNAMRIELIRRRHNRLMYG